jgi:hypothetical protein
MKRSLPVALFLLISVMQIVCAQTNMISTNLLAEQLMLGNYDPQAYMASVILNHPDTISKGINKRVSPDSLHAYLNVLNTFKNRNTISDTTSLAKGIGAARKWVYKKFQQFSAQSGNRLIPSYMQFDLAITNCPNTISQHKNIFAVLPGMDTTDKSVIIIEGHIDSRCAGLCDSSCVAEGMEDNGSGTALVMELARVMSKYSYNRTLVFIATIGEEQGLVGAEAFADYAIQKGIKIKAVLNNDVIGGIICGQTSSAPGCTPPGSFDSTHVRLFSYGGFNSFNKGLARFVKLEYAEMIKPITSVPMTLSVMTSEDRTGRGGDHIPFRQNGFTAIRFTSANEHGNASNGPGYVDRQHTSGDILGVDTDSDQIIDSFYVDFNYLARNAVINGNAAGMAAIGPKTPDFSVTTNGFSYVVDITQQTQYSKYRVGLRTTTNDWDTVFTCTGGTSFSLGMPAGNYIASVASVDTNGVESLFSRELQATVTGLKELSKSPRAVELLQNKPNPADEATMITVLVNKEMSYKDAYIQVRDMKGKEVKKMPITLHEGMNEVEYVHGFYVSGSFIYTLYIDGVPFQSRKMVFTN